MRRKKEDGINMNTQRKIEYYFISRSPLFIESLKEICVNMDNHP